MLVITFYFHPILFCIDYLVAFIFEICQRQEKRIKVFWKYIALKFLQIYFSIPFYKKILYKIYK